MKLQPFKRLMLINLIAIMLIIMQLNTNVVADELNQETIEEAMESYDRASNYEVMYEFFLTLDPKTNSEQYLNTLTMLIDIERFYWHIYELSEHTILLYEEAEKAGDYHYMIKALISLSEINFYNYQNKDGLENLSEALVLIEGTDNTFFLPEYYTALGNFYSDDGDYEMALENFQKALDASNVSNSSGIRQFNYLYAATIMAYEYYYYGEYESSVQVLEEALVSIDRTDFEGELYLQMEIVDYYVLLEDMEKARDLYTEISYDYYKSSIYFQEMYSETYLMRIAGDIAFYDESYKSAAVYYKDAFQHSVDLDNLSDELESVDIINEFNDNKVEEELSLLKAYEASQDTIIRAYQIGLGITVTLIFIIVFVLYIMINQRKKLHELSIKDQLTGVYNRRFILEKYNKISNDIKCIALADLDHFKQVNDTLGHNVGDHVLVTIVEIINASLEQGDYLGRYGGEEFLIVFGSDDPVLAKEKIAKICKEVEHHLWQEEGLNTTISIGLVSSDTLSGKDLIHKADELLYYVKQHGRNGYKYEAV